MTLLSIDSIDVILTPIGQSGRVKYTCFDISNKYLVLGANTGSLYFFERRQQVDGGNSSNPPPPNQIITNDTLTFSQILSFNDIRDSIIQIKICPTNDNLMAVVTSKILYIVEPNLTIRKEKEKILVKMTDHPRDTEITSVSWSPCGQYLYSGDDGGNIFCCSMPKVRRAFFFSAEIVTKLDSRIIQLDVIFTPTPSNNGTAQVVNNGFNQQQPQQPPQQSNSTLIPGITLLQQHQQNQVNLSILASTLTKSVILNYTIGPNTSGKLVHSIPIGKKQRENTKQGACYHPQYNWSVYASRPGKRLWLADPSDGKVLSTMNLKSEDGNVIVPLAMTAEATPLTTGAGPMVFSKLLPFGAHLVSWDERSILLVDVDQVEVLEWRVELNTIQDCILKNNSIYILHGLNRTISRLYNNDFKYIEHQVVIPQIYDENQAVQEEKENQEKVIEPPPIQPPQQQQQPIVEKEDLQNQHIEIKKDDGNQQSTPDVNNQKLEKEVEVVAVVEEKQQPVQIEKQPEQDIVVPSTVTTTTNTPLNVVQEISTPPPQQSKTTTTLEPSLESVPRKHSKENIFADIEMSNNPLISIATTSVNVKKVIKKKIVKKTPTTTPSESSPATSVTSSEDGSTTSNENPTTPSLTKSPSNPQLFDESSSPSTSSDKTTKKVTIVKKKIIKKQTSPLLQNDSNNNNSTPTTPTVPVANTVNDNQSTPPPPLQIGNGLNNSTEIPNTNNTNPSPVVAQDISPSKKEEPITPTNTSSPPVSIKPGNIFKQVTSIQDIKQLAGNTIKSIQKQTIDIKSELITNFSQKILLDYGNHPQPNNQPQPQPLPDGNNSNNNVPVQQQQQQQPVVEQITTPVVVEPEPTIYQVLERLTKVTYDSLLIYRVKKNDMAFIPILQVWLQSFYKVELVPTNDMITELITSCFLMGINITVQDPSGKVCRCWSESVAKTFIERYFTYLSINRLYQYLNQQKWDSCIEKLIEMDSFARYSSRTVASLNQLIDSNDPTCLVALERAVSSQNSQDVGLLFRYIDRLLETQPLESAIFFSRYYPIILPRNIFKFVDQIQPQQPHTPQKGSPNHQNQINQNNQVNQNRLLIKVTYLNQLMKNNLDCGFDQALVEQWFESNIKTSPPSIDLLYHQSLKNSTASTSNMVAKIKSFNIEWKQSAILKSIIKGVIKNQYICNLSRLEEISREYGFMDGLLMIYNHLYNHHSTNLIQQQQKEKQHQLDSQAEEKQGEEKQGETSLANQYFEKLIRLLVQTDNREELTRIMEHNIDQSKWLVLMNEMYEIREYYYKLNDDQMDEKQLEGETNISNIFEISQEYVARLMGRTIGPFPTIDLLQDSPLFESNQLPTNVFAEWIRNGKWSLYHRRLISIEILSRLDSYLWCKKPVNVSPQFWNLIDNDLKSLKQNNQQQQQQQLQKQQSQQQLLDNLVGSNNSIFDNQSTTLQFFEDSSYHWGTETELTNGTCSICTLPLVENPESSFLGVTPPSIIIFPHCGHSYHQCCIEDQGCQLCVSIKY